MEESNIVTNTYIYLNDQFVLHCEWIRKLLWHIDSTEVDVTKASEWSPQNVHFYGFSLEIRTLVIEMLFSDTSEP